MNAQQTTDDLALVSRLMKTGLLSVKPSENVLDSHWHRNKQGEYHYHLDGAVENRLLAQKRDFTLLVISTAVADEQKLDLESIRKIVQRIAVKLRADGKLKVVTAAVGNRPMIYRVV